MFCRKLCAIVSIAFLAGAVTVGCTRYQVAERALDFNFAIETATNRMLLLNAVRGSLRHPMHFSDVSQVTTTPKVASSVGFNLPFGSDALKSFTANPSFELSQTDAITMGPLNKKEFMRGILRPVNFDTIGQYVGQGWPTELLFFMFIETIFLERDRAGFLFHRAWTSCVANTSERCKWFRKELCGLLPLDSRSCLNSNANVVSRLVSRSPAFAKGRIVNDPDEKGKDSTNFRWFNAISLALWVLDFEVLPHRGETGFNTVSRKVKKLGKSKNAKVAVMVETQEPAAPRQLALKTSVPKGYWRSQRRNLRRFCQKPTKTFPPNFCIVKLISTSKQPGLAELGGKLRSPQGMLFYLGELIAAQLNGGENARIAEQIFKVKFGPIRNAAVSVHYAGTTYSVPKGEDGNKSMQALALVNQILNLQKEVKELPTVPTVISTGN